MSYKKPVKIKILDEVNCAILGLSADHIEYFKKTYSFHAPNYFFNPKFKLGAWDGRISFFHKTGKTYVNLLDELVPRIVALGYKLELVDQRTSQPITPKLIDKDFFKHIVEPETGNQWEMRDYQVDMVNALIAAGGGVGVAGTGGGKTNMCAALALAYEHEANLRSIIIVPDKSLTEQTRGEYAFFGLDVGEYSGDCKDTKHMHIVSTWQSLKNNPSMLNEFQMIIVDECHGLKGKVLTKLLCEHGKHIPYRFGVTGTIPKAKTDAMAVKVAVGSVRYTIPAHKLIEQGHLASLHIDIMQLEEDFTERLARYKAENPDNSKIQKMTHIQYKDSYFPEYSAEKRFLQSNKKRLEFIADHIIKKRDVGKGNVLCLVDGINFGKKLAKMIPDAIFVHGKDKTKARKEVYELFKEKDNLVVIATVNIASTGLNIKRIFNLMFIDVGKSFIRVIQSIGRGLRKAPDKDHVDVTDICSDLRYGKRHARERIKFYSEAKYPHKKRIIKYESQDSDLFAENTSK